VPENADLSRIRVEQAADEANRRGLAGPVGADETEHLARPHVEGERGERLHGAVPLHDLRQPDRRHRIAGHWSGISASTGMPAFSTPAVLSTLTLIRYTSLDRSSAVWTLRGVNSARGEMNVTVPAMPGPPASVWSVAGPPSRMRGTDGSGTNTLAQALSRSVTTRMVVRGATISPGSTSRCVTTPLAGETTVASRTAFSSAAIC